MAGATAKLNDTRFLSWGEAMLRFAPTGDQDDWRGQPSARSTFTRTVGGDEMNVCVCLARLGCDAAWASVLPSGPLGDVVRSCAVDAGLRTNYLVIEEGAEIGTYYVLPKDKYVHFQRANSAFSKQRPGLFDWPAMLAERCAGGARAWLHMTGISPMLGEVASSSWTAGISAASAAGVPISVDLNFRPQLGTLAQLWSMVEPIVAAVHLLILSPHSAGNLAEILGLDAAVPAAKRFKPGGTFKVGDGATATTLPFLKAIHAKLNGPAIACCLKERDADGRQTRWSIIIDSTGVHSSEGTPTVHVPKDECGGGSGWAAGAIHRLSADLAARGERLPTRRGTQVGLGPSSTVVAAARRGDLLAALAQETVGDHSVATLADLEAAETQCAGVAARIDGLPVSDRQLSCSPSGSTVDAEARVAAALTRMESAKVIAILRVKNEAAAINRVVELADMGFRAIEVTADSVGFKEETLLPAVIKAIGHRCLVGIGTCMTLADLDIAHRAGAHFALSPVRPSSPEWGPLGFCRECHKRGVLAMPAAYTPQEIYECVEVYGAHTVKIFPAQLWTPSVLKDLKKIGTYGKYRLCPSGGIDCKTAETWLAAGATAVGMGSCLVGGDVGTAPGDAAALSTAAEKWRTVVKPEVQTMAAKLFGNGRP